jgi:hypothetical protein
MPATGTYARRRLRVSKPNASETDPFWHNRRSGLLTFDDDRGRGLPPFPSYQFELGNRVLQLRIA